jgi:hypothetical protein
MGLRRETVLVSLRNYIKRKRLGRSKTRSISSVGIHALVGCAEIELHLLSRALLSSCGQTLWIMANRKAAVNPNKSIAFNDSKAPIRSPVVLKERLIHPNYQGVRLTPSPDVHSCTDECRRRRSCLPALAPMPVLGPYYTGSGGLGLQA